MKKRGSTNVTKTVAKSASSGRFASAKGNQWKVSPGDSASIGKFVKNFYAKHGKAMSVLANE